MIKTIIRARLANWKHCIELFAMGYDDISRKDMIIKPIEFVDIEAGVVYDTPSMQLEYDDAQALMDELWNCGLRPTEGAGSAGAMLATQEHLKDLRSIVDKILPVVINKP